MLRADIVKYFEQYVAQFKLPVHHGVRVTAVEPKPNDQGYQVKTNGTTFEAVNVVIATGLFQRPKVPSFSANLSPDITQLHSGQYRNPQMLPSGARG